MSFDPRDPELRVDPYPLLHRLRADDPIHWSESLNAFVLTGHADMAAISRSPAFGTPRDLFIEELRGRLGSGYAFDYASRRLTFYDNPDLSRLRGLALRAFTPRRIELLRPRIETMTAELFDRAERNVDSDGVVDLREEVFHPLPSMVISEMLGIPDADREFFDRANDPLTHLTAPFLTSEQQAEGETSAALEWNRLEEIVDDRRQRPGNDLLTALIQAEDDDGSAFDHHELIALLMMLFSAGHHTTRDSLAMGLFGYLTGDAQQRRDLHEDPSLLPGAVEEWLRWDTSIIMTTRTARTATTIRGVDIPQGTRCYLHYLAGNRDPERFADPDRFDITRTGSRIMSFGGGMHHCLGSALARLEIDVVIAEFTRRYPEAQLPLDPWVDVGWRPNIVFRGPLAAPVKLGV
ncbi:MAG: cytochrome P450 [Acidimicrobiales bacterium]